MEDMRDSIILGFTSGLFAWVFLNVLAEPKGIFDFYKPAIQKYITLREGKTPLLKLDKVLTQCSKCLGGQIALWYYLITEGFTGFQNFILCFCIAVLTAAILEKNV